MKIKRLLVLGLLAGIFTCACTGCNGGNGSENASADVVYKGNGLTVKEVEKLSEVQYREAEWDSVTLDDALIENDAIFEGIITDVKEVEISGSGRGQIYSTLVEVTAKNELKDRDNKIIYNKTVTIAIPVSSREYDAFVPDFVEGKTCLFLAKYADNVTDSAVDYSKFCDVVVTTPVEYVIPVIATEVYQIRDMFCELFDDSESYFLLKSLINSSSSYHEISECIYNDKEIEAFKAEITVTDKMSITVDGKELLWSFVNKEYAEQDDFILEIEKLHLTSSTSFANAVNKYIENK